MTPARRSLLQGAASLGALTLAPWSTATAQIASPTTAPAARTFSPQPGDWRTFEVTTRVDIPKANGVTRVWLPVPSVNASWQNQKPVHSPATASPACAAMVCKVCNFCTPSLPPTSKSLTSKSPAGFKRKAGHLLHQPKQQPQLRMPQHSSTSLAQRICCRLTAL